MKGRKPRINRLLYSGLIGLVVSPLLFGSGRPSRFQYVEGLTQAVDTFAQPLIWDDLGVPEDVSPPIVRDARGIVYMLVPYGDPGTHVAVQLIGYQE